MLRHNSMGLEPNHSASKLKLMSYPFGAIELESIVLSSNIFHYGASGLKPDVLPFWCDEI